jgi:NDP-sugar pyrophosphorylase family protein
VKKFKIGAIVLAAGKQKRFGSNISKMMVRIGKKTAFDYTMASILSVIEESIITIVSSHLFEPFNQHITENYPQVTIIFDDEPGLGTIFSLKQTLPWLADKLLITESDIYYQPSLIKGLLSFDECGIAITNKVNIAPTHRGVMYQPFSSNDYGYHLNLNVAYRNAGVYLLGRKYQSLLAETTFSNIIDLIRYLNLSDKFKVNPFLYGGTYLHMAEQSDITSWTTTLES